MKSAFNSNFINPKGADVKLLSSRSTNRTYTCTGTALDALISINYIFGITLGNSFNGAFCFTSAAAEALIADYISHY